MTHSADGNVSAAPAGPQGRRRDGRWPLSLGPSIYSRHVSADSGREFSSVRASRQAVVLRYPVRVRTLTRKADSEGVSLPDDVALFIAGRIKSNIRELEGSLIRLLAYASLTGRDISMPLAQEVLRDILRQDERALTIEGIQKFVADYYQMKMGELKSRNNSKSVALPRQVAMYLCKSLTSASLPEIGKSFGGKHHSTVIHSIRKVEDLRRTDAVFNNQVNTLLQSLQ